MSISTNEPLLTKKLCPNLTMSAVPKTDKGGIYRGEAQAIWITTRAPLGKEQRDNLSQMGIVLSQPQPAHSRDSSFVYTAELTTGANLKAFLALPTVLQARGSSKLKPLEDVTPERAALDDLKLSSSAGAWFLENLNAAGVAQKAQRLILKMLEGVEGRESSIDFDPSAYGDRLTAVISETVRTACLSTLQRGPERVTSTRVLAETIQSTADAIRAENRGGISFILAQDLQDLADQLDTVAT
jgi:hypothetical protein